MKSKGLSKGKFRKKPVEIEAMKFDGTNFDECLDFCNADGFVAMMWTNYPEHGINIRTLEGDMTAKAGDWIIRGVKGEFYPCKPDIFKATYDPITND